jgi:hypothetical protein
LVRELVLRRKWEGPLSGSPHGTSDER